MTNTARRPNVHWYIADLIANGFADAFVAAVERVKAGGPDELLGLYMPLAHQEAWARLSSERVPPEVLAKLKDVMKTHPIELTVRKADEERTLLGTFNESHTCPPDCS